MSNQRRLGRGLEALLGRSLEEQNTPAAPAGQFSAVPADAPADSNAGAPADLGPHLTADDQGQRWLDIGVIEPNPFQPRKKFDEVEIADLADSVREHGVLQPLVVRRVGDRFELVAGERRLRAAQAAGWERAPVQLRELSDQQTAELAIVENVQRKDLNAIEKAASFQRYINDYACTQDELAKRIHVDRSTVANLIRLLDLPEGVKQRVVDGELTQGHARALLPVGEADAQEGLAKRIIQEGWSVRRTEQEAQNSVQDLESITHGGEDASLRVIGEDGVSRQPGAEPKPGKSEQLAALERELQTALGTKVALNQNAKGKGKITIHFAGGEEFERLHALLVASQPMAPPADGTDQQPFVENQYDQPAYNTGVG
ncbi:putative chromosome-partitioning protein ParB [Pseudobythopirellula maris]|uniref:Putative chromosome-partitioning protein ParB n=1 Tax=Pseudobythopirellula maris TaxID=2527991 RepID=A0A5C5ZN12_9BACT|nr:ParB/RepB/Spo0J family partition protein [Pseudobythopirellula maris]TWT88455.1 putative chromosome-partitioning protein ParB [Pseudobythopirellula maris]